MTNADAAARPAVAVVVPMYNEAAGARRAVAAILDALAGLPAGSRLIAVDDGSTDGTGALLDALAAGEPRLDVVRHAGNRGYGAALATGARAAARAGLEAVVFMDSDLTNDPADLPRFVDALAAGADVVKATRFQRGGGMRGVPFGRAIVSRTGNLVARVLFRAGLTDCTNGFRAVRTALLARLRLRETRFPVIAEELYCLLFLTRRFAEVPVVLTSRRADLRPTAFVYRPAVLWGYLKYALLAFARVPPGDRLAGPGAGAGGPA